MITWHLDPTAGIGLLLLTGAYAARVPHGAGARRPGGAKGGGTLSRAPAFCCPGRGGRGGGAPPCAGAPPPLLSLPDAVRLPADVAVLVGRRADHPVRRRAVRSVR